jgi:hypothetical protein
MVGGKLNPIQKLTSLIPRSQSQFETEVKYVLKLAFWAALLAPVIIVPAYYLVLALIR